MQEEIDDYLMHPETEKDIKEACDELADLLIGKNRAYGDSALNPIRAFSKSDTLEQLRVRMDDKLSRLMRGSETEMARFAEETEWELAGYIILLHIAKKRATLKARNDEQARSLNDAGNLLTPRIVAEPTHPEGRLNNAYEAVAEAPVRFKSPEKSPRALMGS